MILNFSLAHLPVMNNHMMNLLDTGDYSTNWKSPYTECDTTHPQNVGSLKSRF